MTKSILSLLIATVLPAAPSLAARPNIVVIYTDDVGYGDVSCYEGCDFKTPHIDRLAAEGLRFTHAYSNPLCTPTRVDPRRPWNPWSGR